MISWLSQRLAPPVSSPVGEPRDLPLEGLRGLCAVLVMYAHIFAPAHWLDLDYAPSRRFWWFNSGSVAVLFFFVLSGYVIGVTVRTPATSGSVKGYLMRRLVRLVPINTVAVLLVWFLFPAIKGRSIWGSLCFLQNARPYFGGWSMPIIGNNYNLWSLNYEMVYYLAFLAIWRLAPRTGILWAGTLVVGAAATCVDGFPAILSDYGCGALFWIAGLSVAWLTPRDRATGNWPSALLLLLIIWPLDLLNKLVPAVLPAGMLARGPASPVNRLDILPVCVWLLLAVTGRGRRWHRPLALVCLGWASLAVLGSAMTGDYFNGGLATLIYAALVVVAWSLVNWAPTPTLLAKIAPLGLISFGLYAVSLPIEFSLSHQSILPSGTAGSFAVRVVVLVALSVGAAWILERKLQPALRRIFIRKSARLTGGAL